MKTEFMIIRPLKLGEYHYHAVPKSFPVPDRFGNALTHNLNDAKTWATKAEAQAFLGTNAEFAATHRLYPLEVEASSNADFEDELDGLDLEDQLDLLLSLED